MRSTLDKALLALLNEDKQGADELFHQFVLQRARAINESIVTTGDVDTAALVDEGKTFKRNDDDEVDADTKKKEDKERKAASQQKRAVPVEEGKTFKRNDDEDDEVDVKAKRKEDKQSRDAKKTPVPVEEGKLEMTQGDDGTLTVVHTPDASVESAEEILGEPLSAEVTPFEVSELPADLEVGPETDMDFELSDEEFERLGESFANDLEKIVLGNKDGVYANGEKSSQETHSPVPNVKASDRADKAAPAVVKGTEHNGFDREPAPKSEANETRQNVATKANDTLIVSSKEGDSKALLNQIGDDKAAKSPIAGK